MAGARAGQWGQWGQWSPPIRVVVHKMTVRLDVSDWRAGPRAMSAHRPAKGGWEVPHVGAVLVDEAQNLFDASGMCTRVAFNGSKCTTCGGRRRSTGR